MIETRRRSLRRHVSRTRYREPGHDVRGRAGEPCRGGRAVL